MMYRGTTQVHDVHSNSGIESDTFRTNCYTDTTWSNFYSLTRIEFSVMSFNIQRVSGVAISGVVFSRKLISFRVLR